jgi:hypothetical protein
MVSYMPTNRIPTVRVRRSAGFSPEALDLFRALEKVKPSRRFKDPRTQRLAELLGLTSEFWTVNYVNDVAPPCHPPHYQANVDWATCRALREQLLAATGLEPVIKKNPARKAGPKAEDAQPCHGAASDVTSRAN